MRLAILTLLAGAAMVLVAVFAVGHVSGQKCADWVKAERAGGGVAALHETWLRIAMAGAEAAWMMEGDGTDPFAGVPHASRHQRLTNTCTLNPDWTLLRAAEAVASEIIRG